MKTIEMLIAAKELIRDEGRWTTRAWARTGTPSDVLRMFDSAIRSLQRKAKKRKPASNRKNANRKKAKR